MRISNKVHPPVIRIICNRQKDPVINFRIKCVQFMKRRKCTGFMRLVVIIDPISVWLVDAVCYTFCFICCCRVPSSSMRVWRYEFREWKMLLFSIFVPFSCVFFLVRTKSLWHCIWNLHLCLNNACFKIKINLHNIKLKFTTILINYYAMVIITTPRPSYNTDYLKKSQKV